MAYVLNARLMVVKFAQQISINAIPAMMIKLSRAKQAVKQLAMPAIDKMLIKFVKNAPKQIALNVMPTKILVKDAVILSNLV